MFINGTTTGTTAIDYGDFNAGVDNPFISAVGWVDGDITGDGLVTGDGYGDPAIDDVAAFVANWKVANLVMGYAVGDGNSRAMGDFNYDGIVDLFDWHILRTNHPGGVGLNLGELLASAGVPEPSTLVLLLLGAVIVGLRKKVL